MPFTLAHPAAILPLRGWRYLRTAPLIIGAMVPDLPYYIPVTLGRYVPKGHTYVSPLNDELMFPGTHTIAGSYSTCLLLGYVVLLGVFLLRQPLTALLSARARWLYLAALAPFRHEPVQWLLAPFAIIIGVWTHLLWDSFTHPHGWVVRRVSALSAPVTIGSYTGQVCHVLQYLSSVFGLVVIVVWYLHLPAPRAVHAAPGGARSSVGPVLLLVAAAATLIGAVQATESWGRESIYSTGNLFLTHTLAWFGLLYLVAGTIITLERSNDAALN
jgi:hypothetical protein